MFFLLSFRVHMMSGCALYLCHYIPTILRSMILRSSLVSMCAQEWCSSVPTTFPQSSKMVMMMRLFMVDILSLTAQVYTYRRTSDEEH